MFTLIILIFVFAGWAIYKIFIDKNRTKEDMKDIMGGLIMVAIVFLFFYLIFR